MLQPTAAGGLLLRVRCLDSVVNIGTDFKNLDCLITNLLRVIKKKVICAQQLFKNEKYNILQCINMIRTS